MKRTTQIVFVILVLIGSFQVQSQVSTVMSFNIRYDNKNDKENWWHHRKEEVVQFITKYHPDFLGIQEGLYDQVVFIQQNLKEYNYIGFGRDDGYKKGEFTAIYYDTTKFELIKSTTFWLSEKPDVVSVGWDASMERICTYGKFKNIKTNKFIHVFNAHFDHIGVQSQEMSAKVILSKIKEYCEDDAPIVVLGDFNCSPLSTPIQVLKSRLSDGQKISKTKPKGPVGTFNRFDVDVVPVKRIDYIFTSNVEVKAYAHLDDKRSNNLWISDHLPVLIKIKSIKTK